MKVVRPLGGLWRWLACGGALTLLGFGVGCDESSPRAGRVAYPNAGLFTPGSLLGASDPTDQPDPTAGLGDRCVQPPSQVDAGLPTFGTLTVAYRTQSLDGRYAPKNCTVVWIETDAGDYVTTLELNARLRVPGLVYFDQRGCLAKLGPDVITGATLRDHETNHELSWEGTDFAGDPVPDGTYRLMIEVTETDKEPGELYEFPFEKSPEPYDTDLGVDRALQSLSLSWVVTAQAGVVEDDVDLDAGE